MSNFVPANEITRQRAKRDLLGVGPQTLVIVVVARLDPQKRSTMVPAIADNLRSLGAKDFIIVMVGSGESADELKEKVKLFGVEGKVRLMGTVQRPQEFLAAADIFLLPSVSEGISIAVAEAMAMALPIVTARAGALPEQLGEEVTATHSARSSFFGLKSRFAKSAPSAHSPSLPALKLAPRSVKDSNSVEDSSRYPTIAGVLVNHTLNDKIDAKLYAVELFKLVSDPTLRARYGQVGRELVERTSDWRTTLKGLFPQLDLARQARPNTQSWQNPAAHFAIQNLLLEAKGETDFAVCSFNHLAFSLSLLCFSPLTRIDTIR